MTDAAILSPLREGHLAYQDRLDPLDRFPFARRHAGRVSSGHPRLLESQSLKSLHQIASAFHGEARADLAGITQLTGFSVTQIQRSQRPFALARLTEAENNKFLPLPALAFQPGVLAPRLIA